jgi:hypothetical protein
MSATTVITVAQGEIQGDHITGEEICVRFETAPGFTDATIRLFCIGGVFGIGVYPEPGSGTVLRWHDGPSGEPRVIHWHAPTGPDDVCR